MSAISQTEYRLTATVNSNRSNNNNNINNINNNASVTKYQYQLFHHEQVPHVFREIGIRTGYRSPGSSPKECLISAFTLTNETLNFWTHFLPFWYFVWTFRDFYSNQLFADDSYNWPFLAYLATVCAWPMVSCLAHLFSVMSEDARHICFFVDYLSLSWYSFGVATVYHAYSFDQVFFNTVYSKMYLIVAACASLLCTTLACWSRFVSNQKAKKVMRVLAFVVPYIVTSVPLLERVVHCYVVNCTDESMPMHLRQFCWAFVGILFYALHIPECFAPGYFDIVGNSHQILHIMGILASYDQMRAIYTDLMNRRQLFINMHSFPSGLSDVNSIFIVLLADILIVLLFSFILKRRIYRTYSSENNLQNLLTLNEREQANDIDEASKND